MVNWQWSMGAWVVGLGYETASFSVGLVGVGWLDSGLRIAVCLANKPYL